MKIESKTLKIEALASLSEVATSSRLSFDPPAAAWRSFTALLRSPPAFSAIFISASGSQSIPSSRHIFLKKEATVVARMDRNCIALQASLKALSI